MMSSNSSDNSSLHLLSSLLHYDNVLHNATSTEGGSVRKGNLEVLTSSASEEVHDEIAICNLAALIPFGMSVPPPPGGEGGGEPFIHYLTDLYGLVASQLLLAVHHLNTGNGSIVRDLEKLDQRCNIRFTLEFLDTGLQENVAVDAVIQATDRLHPQPTICGFQGASLSSVSMSTATITSLRGFPQISAASTSPFLSSSRNAQQLYPLFGRTIPSDDAIAIPIMDYYQSQLQIEHLAVLYVNDPYGTAFLRGLQEAVSSASPMSLKSVEIAPIVDDEQQATANVQRAISELKSTQYQYIFAIINNKNLLERILREAYSQNIAGDSQHTWMFSDSSLGTILESKVGLESPIHQALKGSGVIMPSAGLAQHVPNLQTYYDQLNDVVNNSADWNYILQKSPNPKAFATSNILPPTFDSNDPYAPFIYDSIVALGLGACNANKAKDANSGATTTTSSNSTTTASTSNNEYFTGIEHFQAMTRTTFVGASGPVVLNAETGSREPSSAYYGLYQVLDVPSTKADDISNATTQDATVQFNVAMSSLYDHGTWNILEPFVFADGSVGNVSPPSDLPPLVVNPNHLGTGWRISGWILCGLGMMLALGFAVWTYAKAMKKDRVITASQPFFLYIICGGMATFFASILPLGVDEEIATEEGCAMACNAVIWLLSIGFCVTFSAMFTKTQRVNRIFKHPGFTRIRVTPVDVVKPMISCLGVNVILLVVMALIRPIQWTVHVIKEDSFERPTETQGFCEWSNSIPFLIPLAGINLGCLLYAIIQAYEARGISIEFAESEYTFRCMLVIFLAGFISFPVLVLIHDNSNAYYFFFSVTILITGSLVLLLMFVPKIRFLLEQKRNPRQRNDNVRVSIMGFSSLPPAQSGAPSRFFSPTTNNYSSSSSEEAGLLVLSHPKTETALRERVADLESRLKKYADRCTCERREAGSEGNSSGLPLQEQASSTICPEIASSAPSEIKQREIADSVMTA